MLTYSLLKTQSIISSATSRKGQPDADLHAVQNPEHACVSNKQEGPSQMLTYILFKAQSIIVSATRRQMLTYILYKTQSMLLSATS